MPVILSHSPLVVPQYRSYHSLWCKQWKPGRSACEVGTFTIGASDTTQSLSEARVREQSGGVVMSHRWRHSHHGLATDAACIPTGAAAAQPTESEQLCFDSLHEHTYSTAPILYWFRCAPSLGIGTKPIIPAAAKLNDPFGWLYFMHDDEISNKFQLVQFKQTYLQPSPLLTCIPKNGALLMTSLQKFRAHLHL